MCCQGEESDYEFYRKERSSIHRQHLPKRKPEKTRDENQGVGTIPCSESSRRPQPVLNRWPPLRKTILSRSVEFKQRAVIPACAGMTNENRFHRRQRPSFSDIPATFARRLIHAILPHLSFLLALLPGMAGSEGRRSSMDFSSGTFRRSPRRSLSFSSRAASLFWISASNPREVG